MRNPRRHAALTDDQKKQVDALYEKLRRSFADWTVTEARIGEVQGAAMNEWDSAPVALARRDKPSSDPLTPSAYVVAASDAEPLLLGLLNSRMDKPFLAAAGYGVMAAGLYFAPVAALAAAGAGAVALAIRARKKGDEQILPLLQADADPQRPATRLALHLLRRHPGQVRDFYWEAEGHVRPEGSAPQKLARKRAQGRAMRLGILAAGGGVTLVAAPAAAPLLALASAGIALVNVMKFGRYVSLWRKIDEADPNVAAALFDRLRQGPDAPRPQPRVITPPPAPTP